MGITADEFFEKIYRVIFTPKEFFEQKDMTVSVRLALSVIIMIALINKVSFGIFDGSIMRISFLFSLLWAIILTVSIWFFTSLFFEYIAKIFNRDGNLEKLLFFTAFAPMPYIFFAPLNLIKNIGEIGYVIATIVEVLLYFWIIFLYALAIRAAYNITISRAFMLIFIPFLSLFFAIYWLVCFISKIWYIFSI